MNATVTFKAVTTADEIRLFVDGKNVPLQKGSGVRSVRMNDEFLLSWTVVGGPGATYEVSIAPEKGQKVVMLSGVTPTKSRIPRSYFTAAGSVRFKITQETVA